MPWLSLIIWLPSLAALLIGLLPGHWRRSIQALALSGGGVAAALSLGLYQQFYASGRWSDFHFVEYLPWLESAGISYKLGVDGLSASLVALTGLVSLAALLMSLDQQKRSKEYFILTLLAISGVYGVFASLDLFFLVIFYEMASIPMYFLVGIWGSDKLTAGRPIYKEQAATKLLLYLQLGGGVVLLGILALYFAAGGQTFDLQHLLTLTLSANHQRILFFIFFVGFAIEAGLVPFHTWLTEGHSSAPTPLSMLLAGVLLKMGGYGILRLCLQLNPLGASFWLPLVGCLGVLNILYGGLCALRQSDVKVMIAYSSVSHMGMVFLGMAALVAGGTSAQHGLLGSHFQLFAHGVITALLFAVAGAVYQRTHSRDLRAWGGLAARAPIYTCFYLLAAMGSLGLPGLPGFWAEFLVLLGAWGWSKPLALAALPGLLFTSMFLLRSIQYGFFGPLNPDHLEVRDADFGQLLALGLLAGAALLVGLLPFLLTGPALAVLGSLVKGAVQP